MGTRRERILQKLNPHLLNITPRLSGNEGSVIDLDSEDSLDDGAKKLMMRFIRNQDLCEKNKRNLALQETKLTISTAKYNESNEICELITETLSSPFVRSDDEVSERPGRTLQQLKTELQEKMSAKWLEEYNKRVSKSKSVNEWNGKKKKKDLKRKEISEGEDEESKDIMKEFDTDDDANDADIEYEEEEEDKDYDTSSIANDKEVNENECEDKLEEKDDEYDDEEGCSLVPAYQPGGGMLYGGSELTQNDDSLLQNLLSPSLRFTPSEFGSKMSECVSDQTPKKSCVIPNEETRTSFTEKVKLFSQNPNDSFDLNDAFEFCSGKFPDCGAEDKGGKEGDEDECDDKFQTGEELVDDFQDMESKNKSRNRTNIITFEDSEAEEEKEINVGFKVDEAEDVGTVYSKLLSDSEDEFTSNCKTEVKKSTRMNLHFSDEEDAENDCGKEESNRGNTGGTTSNDEDEVDSGDECEQRSVHYDSEENEIINPKEFFEKEAELSGSEWSGDEDEKGMDEFEVEEGDADNLDEDQVRSQLGKIHVRRLLDDDAREVRLIQEILFEDGDLYTDGKIRERKFKWKNIGTFDEQENEGGPKEDDGNSSENDGAGEEEMKMRHEKELFFMEKMAKKNEEEISSDEEIVGNFHTIKVVSMKTSDKPFGNGEKTVDNSKSITGHNAISEITKLSNTRGSFLTRNEQFLLRLAKSTSGVTDNVLGPKSSKNFVFATKSPEKFNSDKSTALKRRVEERCSPREKKMKLLPREIDTGTSILDLLV